MAVDYSLLRQAMADQLAIKRQQGAHMASLGRTAGNVTRQAVLAGIGGDPNASLIMGIANRGKYQEEQARKKRKEELDIEAKEASIRATDSATTLANAKYNQDLAKQKELEALSAGLGDWDPSSKKPPPKALMQLVLRDPNMAKAYTTLMQQQVMLDMQTQQEKTRQAVLSIQGMLNGGDEAAGGASQDERTITLPKRDAANASDFGVKMEYPEEAAPLDQTTPTEETPTTSSTRSSFLDPFYFRI